MSILAIINPASGGGKTDSEIYALKQSLNKITEHIQLTEYPGHATELVKASTSIQTIVVAGGDGTLFECLNGINGFEQTIALIPVGTGNSLAQELGIKNWKTGVATCTFGEEQKIDAIRIRYKSENGHNAKIRGLATIGLGYPANAVVLGNNKFKKLRQWCYPVSGLIQSFGQNKIIGTARLDNIAINLTGVTGIFINNTQYAGNFRAFPNASISDGVFDIMVMSVGPIRQNIQNLMVLMENYSYMPSRSYQAKKFTVELKVPIPLMVDGEIIPDIVEAEFSIESGSVNCRVPGRPFAK